MIYYIRYIIIYFFNIIINIYSSYIMYTRKKDGIFKKTDFLFQNYDNKYYYLEQYNVVQNDKTHDIVFLSDTKYNVKDDYANFLLNKKEIFEKRNLVLHCGLKDFGSDIEDDITFDFRSFMYYFDKDKIKLDAFFSYINADKNGEFIIYINDGNLTEKKYLVNDLLEKSFKEIVFI